MNILNKIIRHKKNEIDYLKLNYSISQLESSSFFERDTISLKSKLISSNSGIIAEHKRKSPSKDIINNNLKINTFDLIIDAVGSKKTRETAIKFARPGSVIVHAGLTSSDGDFDFRKTFHLEVSVTGRGRRTSQLVSIRGGGIGSDLFNKLEYFKLPDLPLPVIKILLQLALCILNVMCWVIPIKSQNFTQNTYALGLFNFFILRL